MEAVNNYDLIICGGGPAGTSAAITAATTSGGIRVLLIEAGSFPRHKICGEFFSPEAATTLKALLGDGGAMPGYGLRIHRVGLHARGVSTSFALPTPAFSITRHDLDAALWNRTQQLGITCLERTRVLAIARDDNGFDVKTSGGSFSARCVINATGRWSEVNNSTAGRTKLIGIKAHFETGAVLDPTCDLHFFRGGYIGIQPISETVLNASALVDASRYRDMDSVLRAAGLADRSRTWQGLYSPITCPPVSFTSPVPIRDGVINCGDAAAFIDPFAGDGMSLALHSGVLAGEYAVQVARGMSGADAAASYEHEYRRRFAGAFRSAARIRRFAFAPDWMQSLSIAALRFPFVAHAALASTRAS